jgi:hypothetical protein
VVSVQVGDQQRIAYNFWAPLRRGGSELSSRLCAEMLALVDVNVALAARASVRKLPCVLQRSRRDARR